MSKVQRQQTLARLISEHAVSSQTELLELLEGEGIVATQATVSRDLEELGAIKRRVGDGAAIYALAELETDRHAPLDYLRRVMGEWVASVAVSGDLVVLRTPPGCAQVVASALDRSGLDGLLGTVAGDDTMFCVAAEDVGGHQLAVSLQDLARLPVVDDAEQFNQQSDRPPAS